MHPCPSQTGLETEKRIGGSRIVLDAPCVTCQDVPIAVVHPDIGPGTHGIGVEYCHSLPNWNNEIILIVLFPRTSEGFLIMRDADAEIRLLNIFAFGLHVLQWPFATDSFFIFPVRYSICE